MKKIYTYTRILCLFFLLSGWIGCTDERDCGSITTPGNTEKEVTFSLQIGSMATRATPSVESHVDNLHIIVLDEVAGNYTYSYTVAASRESNGLFTGILQATDDPVKCILIANSTTPENLNTGDNEEIVKKKIVHAFNEAGPEFIPMAGETVSENGIPLEGTLNLPVRMIRSVAAVEVSLADDVSFEWSDRFILQSMRAYRVNSHLQVIHNDCNDNHIVEDPSIPDAAVRAITTERIAAPEADRNVATLSGLYIPEAEVCPDAQSQEEEATYLVIGGIYLGNDPNNTQTSYYRVDIKNSSGDEFGQVLRNHKYYITIHDVHNEGTPEPGDAANTDALLTLEVQDWLEDNDTQIVYGPDNKYFAFSPSDVVVAYYIGAERIVHIQTNYDYYTIQWIDENGTIKSQPVGTGEGFLTTEFFTIENNGSTLRIVARQENSGPNATERYEWLLVTAGDISCQMKVTQLAHTSHKRTYISVFSFMELLGNLGDDVLTTGYHDDDAIATVLRNFFKNDSYFGVGGTLSFGGFSLSAIPKNRTLEVPLSAQMANLFDCILIPYDFNSTTSQAQVLANWLNKDDAYRVLMLYTHESTILQSLGNVGKSMTLGSGQKYLLSTNAPEFVTNGPFGKVDANSGLSALMETTVNISVLDITNNSNRGIKPILVNSANPNEVIFGIDPEKRIIYMGDPYLFQTASQHEGIASLFSEDGWIQQNRPPDILLCNLIAWIAETVIGEELAPREE